MAINRFYQPAQAQYVSQFVPNKMPFDLMLAGLERKQKQYDTQDALQNQILGDWKLDALEGYDTQRRDELKSEVRGFLDNSMDKDLASPEYQREYLNFVRGLRDNQDIASISSAYNTAQAEIKRRDELKKSNNPFEWTPAMEHDFQQRMKIYTLDPKLGGKGFKGDVKLGDPTILAGVDKQSEYEKSFDQLKPYSKEILGALGNGLFYKNGQSTIDDERIKQRVNETIGIVAQGPAGRQAGKEFDMMRFPDKVPSIEYEKMSEAEKKKYDEDKLNHIVKEFFGVGLGFQDYDYTTNEDQALNKMWDFGNQQSLLYPNQPVVKVAGQTTGTDRTFKTDMAKYMSRKQTIGNLDWKINSYEAAKANPNVSTEMYQLSLLTPKQIEDLKVEREMLLHESKQDEARFHNAKNKSLLLLDSKIDENMINQNSQFKLGADTYNLTSRLRELDPEIQRDLKLLNDTYSQLNKGQMQILLDGSQGSELQKRNYLDKFNATLKTALNKIEKLKKDPKLTDEDKKSLHAAEQQIRINHQLMRSQIPESAYIANTSLIDLLDIVSDESDKSFVGVSVGKETFERELEKEYDKSSSAYAPDAIAREADVISPYNMTTRQLDKPRNSAHSSVEKQIVQNITGQQVMYNGKIIQPNDPDYPIMDKEGVLVSENISKMSGSNTPIFTFQFNKRKPGFGDQTEKGTYTIIAKGIDANSYYANRNPELLAKVKADPNSSSAIIALNAVQMYNDPKLNQDVTSFANIKIDDQYISNQYESSDENKAHFGNTFHVEVLKQGDGAYQYQVVYDDSGVKTPTLVAKNLAELNNVLTGLKK